MAPHEGLVHLKEYDIKDSNVELIGTDIDHKVKHNSAATEPAWNNGRVGVEPGLFVWRIEDFQVVPVPKERYGSFYEGDSYIVLHTYKVGSKDAPERLGHDIFFWLGAKTTQDEAGTAAYKTVELDEFLGGKATQHREIQVSPSEDFLALFPRLTVRRGGVASGFRHVEDAPKDQVLTLLRVFKHPGAAAGRDTIVVHEVEPSFRSLDENDVFILDKGDKIWVWQGKHCSPMEKAKAAQVVHDMTLAKHVDVEVLAQSEARSRLVVKELGGDDDADGFHTARPLGSSHGSQTASLPRRLFRLSDASGQLSFGLVKEDSRISWSDLDGNDVFIFDDGGKSIWVWEGSRASRAERASWLKVAQAYLRHLQGGEAGDQAHLTPIAKVNEGNESPAFARAIQVA